MKRKRTIVSKTRLSPEAKIRSAEISLEAARSATLQLRDRIKALPGFSDEVDKHHADIRVKLKELAQVINRRKAK